MVCLCMCLWVFSSAAWPGQSFAPHSPLPLRRDSTADGASTVFLENPPFIGIGFMCFALLGTVD